MPAWLLATGIAGALVALPFSFTWKLGLPRLWLQVLGVGLGLMLAFIAYTLCNPSGVGPFWSSADRLEGFLAFTVVSLLLNTV